MKVSDRRRKLSVKRIETYPDYLQVKVGSLASAARKSDLYTIDVDVPADAPPSNHLQNDPAWFRIVTDDPAVPEIRLPIEFVVLSP
jgi:hypothetical protein